MFKSLYPIFKEVLTLAKQSEMAYEQEQKNGLHAGGSIDNYMAERKQYPNLESELLQNELTRYLNTLDFDTIKILQNIMYIGREIRIPVALDGDGDYGYYAGCEVNCDEDDNFFKDMNPEEIYRVFENEADGRWHTKEIEISQMISKLPLGSYLKRGFEILNINL